MKRFTPTIPSSLMELIPIKPSHNNARNYSLFRSSNVKKLLEQVKDYKPLPLDEVLLDGRRTKIYGFIKMSSLDSISIVSKPSFTSEPVHKERKLDDEEIIAIHYRIEKKGLLFNKLHSEYLLFRRKPLDFIFQRNMADQSTRELIKVDFTDRQLLGELKFIDTDQLLPVFQRERSMIVSSDDLSQMVNQIEQFASGNEMKILKSLYGEEVSSGKFLVNESILRDGDLVMLMGKTSRIINYDEFTCLMVSAFSEEKLIKDISKLV